MLASLGFIADNPFMFVYNLLIILMTLSLSHLFTRRNFVLMFLSAVWIGLGVANFVLLGFRTTPLAAIDFYILKSVFGIIDIYLSTVQIVILVALLVGALAVLAWAWKILPKSRVNFRRTVVKMGVNIVLLLAMAHMSATVGFDFSNIGAAYDKYGFAYCFATSVIDRGIPEPEDYSPEKIQEILAAIDAEANPAAIKPNVIFLQLESFFDVNYVKGLKVTENPLPNFTDLKSNYSSGFLTVPSVGAGTANVEFEILTGMKLGFFGLGEYPYKTILQTTTTEAIGYNLAELGYTNHALHNNTATFYDRNAVFTNLGFDTFVSIEYMNGVEYTPNSWAKDAVLTHEIIKAMESTPAQDFVFAISVQAHGKYPDEVIDENPPIKVLAAHDEDFIVPFEYFVNQVYEVDEFLGELIAELESFTEPVVLVVFGDHLPSLSLEDDDLENGDRFQAEYVLWSNFPMEKDDRDLTSYQLSAYTLERLGFNNGYLTKLHQTQADTEGYQDKLHMIQYDMLYGEQYLFNGVNPYPQTDLQMGTSEILITAVSQKGKHLYIYGEDFTPWSVVYIDGKAKDTEFISSTTLFIEDEKLESESVIYVAQVSPNRRVLSQTQEWIVE